jgi:hypothetical protein
MSDKLGSLASYAYTRPIGNGKDIPGNKMEGNSQNRINMKE